MNDTAQRLGTPSVPTMPASEVTPLAGRQVVIAVPNPDLPGLDVWDWLSGFRAAGEIRHDERDYVDVVTDDQYADWQRRAQPKPPRCPGARAYPAGMVRVPL